MKLVQLEIVVLCLLITGCMLKTRSEVEDLEGQKQIQNQVTTIQQTKIDQDGKILAIQDELRAINGKMQGLEQKIYQTPQGPSNQDLIDQMKIFETQLQALKLDLDELKSRQNAQPLAATSATSQVINKEIKKDVDEDWQKAEDLFSKKDWKNAILAYQAYRDKNSKGKQVAEATYKIGVCFQELKMKDEARAFYEEVLQKFPKSSTAKKARFRLNQLK